MKKLTENSFKVLSSLMQPIGFNERGELLYSLKSLANLLGIPVDDLIEDAKQTPGVEIFPVISMFK